MVASGGGPSWQVLLEARRAGRGDVEAINNKSRVKLSQRSELLC